MPEAGKLSRSTAWNSLPGIRRRQMGRNAGRAPGTICCRRWAAVRRFFAIQVPIFSGINFRRIHPPRQRARPDPLATIFESRVAPIPGRRPDIKPLTVFHDLRNTEPEFKPNYRRTQVDLDQDAAAFWRAALTESDGIIARIRAFSST